MFNNTKKTSRDGVTLLRTLLRRHGMLLGHFERNWDAIPPHPAPPQALLRCIFLIMVLHILSQYNNSS
jgi:hypothetical protein